MTFPRFATFRPQIKQYSSRINVRTATRSNLADKSNPKKRELGANITHVHIYQIVTTSKAWSITKMDFTTSSTTEYYKDRKAALHTTGHLVRASQLQHQEDYMQKVKGSGQVLLCSLLALLSLHAEKKEVLLLFLIKTRNIQHRHQ
jgi:hypothetical protein